jgi:flagellar motor switch protein FliM
MTQVTGAVLKKKVNAIQTRGYSFPIQRELAAKLEYASAKGATSALRVTTEAIVEHSRVGRLDALIDALPTPGLFSLLQYDSGGTALIGFDMKLVDHVVDILAGGDANIARSLPTRTPTAIDAALCRKMGGSMLAHFDEEIRVLTDSIGLTDFRWGRTEHLPTSLQYTMPDQQYLVFRVNLDIGDDARVGGFHLALPLTLVEPIETILRHSGTVRSQGESEVWIRHMRKVVKRAQLKVTAVIDRCQMDVADLARLEVGGLFALSDATLDDVVLEMTAGETARSVGRGRLGAFKRNKAVRIIEPPECGFLEPLAEELGVPVEHE